MRLDLVPFQVSSSSRNSILTARDKVMIHLRGFQKFYDDADSPFGVTQDGISEGVGIGRNNVSKIMKGLIASNLVEERTKHVRGLPRKRKVYHLTGTGYIEADELRKTIEGTTIEVIDFDGERSRTEVRNLNHHLPKRFSLLEIAMGVRSGVFDARSFYDTNVRVERSHVDHTDKRPAIRRFFGRDDEIRILKKSLTDPGVKAVVIQGSPGAGKTTLLAKFTRDETKDVNILWFHIQEWTSVKMLYSNLSEFLSKLGHKGLEMYLSSVDEPKMQDAVPILEKSLSDVEGLIVLDDIQKASEELNGLIHALFDVVRGARGLRIMCTSRSTGGFFNRKDVLEGVVVELDMGGLDPSSSRQLLEDRGITEGIEEIIEVTEGYPLFLELLDPGRVIMGRDLRLYIEQELLSDMDDTERFVIEMASVLRYPVVEDAFFAIEEGIMTLQGKDINDLSYEDYTVDYDVIAGLLRKSMMRESIGRVIGTHDLVREFVYSRIPPRKRQLYHRASSKYYMEGRSPSSYMESIYHSMMANDRSKASGIAVVHGNELLDGGFAQNLLPALLELIEDGGSESIDLRILLARSMQRSGDWDGSISSYQELIDDVDEDVNPRMAFEIRRELGSLYIRKHDTDSAGRFLKDALRLSDHLTDADGKVELYYDLGGLGIIGGQLDEAETMFDSSLHLAEDLEDIEGIGKAYYGLSRVRLQNARFEESYEFAKRGGEILEMSDRISLRIQIKQAMASSLRHLRRFDEAIGEQTDAIDLSNEYGDPFLRMSAIMNLGVMKVEMGDLDAGKECLQESKMFFRRVGDDFTVSFIGMTMGIAMIKEGDVQNGDRLVAEGIALLRENDNYYSLLAWSIEVGKVLYHAGYEKIAKEYLDRAQPYLDEMDEMTLSEEMSALREMIDSV